MSKTEGLVDLDTENKASVGDKPNVEKEKKAPFGNMIRKKLADISNLPQPARVSILDEKSHLMPIATKEYIELLKKENLALMKILAERNKIIEVTGIELQRMKVNLQKLQQQNLQLAQSNSQMLADLNSGKDRLKSVQHELGCKNGLLKAKNLEEEERLKSKKCKKFDDELEVTNCEAVEETNEYSKVGRDDDKCGNTRRKTKSKSLGPKQVQSKDELENKRPCVRRRSARFRPEKVKPLSDLLEIGETKVSLCFPSIENGPTPQNDGASASVSIQEEGGEGNCSLGHEAGNKRIQGRRQSARFKCEEPKLSDDLAAVEDARVIASVPNDGADVSNSRSLFLENDDSKANAAPQNDCTSANVSIQEEGRECKCAPGHEAGNKRARVRRQSARLKSEESKLSDDLFAIEEAKVAAAVPNDGADISTSMNLLLKIEDNKANPAPGFETVESRRSSLRPLRQAAKKVQSYKEIPLNIKMRRSE